MRRPQGKIWRDQFPQIIAPGRGRVGFFCDAKAPKSKKKTKRKTKEYEARLKSARTSPKTAGRGTAASTGTRDACISAPAADGDEQTAFVAQGADPTQLCKAALQAPVVAGEDSSSGPSSPPSSAVG